MTTILYPTRGGQSSYSNQDRVIEIAKERGAKLVFLYVSNVRFLEHVTRPAPIEIVEEELDHMGDFLLAMAQERAEKAGWQADAIVRHGSFREAVWTSITELDVDVLVLGAPGNSHAVTTKNLLLDMIGSMTDEFDLEVIVIRDGEIVEHQKT
jgi:nucleotide-binding universal stress UspA family protein